MSEEIKKDAEEVKAEPVGEITSYLIDKKFKVQALGQNASGFEMIAVDANDLVAIAKDLKRSMKMNLLNFLTALEVKEGYQTVYQFEETATGKAVSLKVTVARDKPTVPSLTEVYPTANWFEREAYDMLGINYEGHPNLTRILNPDDWEGYPLRRDYIGPCDELNQPISLATK
jgi:NAD(P)H-quinone oxidoreductase subunit J